MFTDCPEHAYVRMLPCPWPDCSRGVAGESIPSLMPSLSAAGHERRSLRGPDGALRYFWTLADMPMALAVGNLVRSEQERRAGPSPKLLYHYTPLAGFLGIVESETLWMTDYSYLNDAREFQLGVERATTILTNAVGDTRYAELHSVLADLLEDLRAMPAERILLTCFCGNQTVSATGIGTRSPGSVSRLGCAPQSSCRASGIRGKRRRERSSTIRQGRRGSSTTYFTSQGLRSRRMQGTPSTIRPSIAGYFSAIFTNSSCSSRTKVFPMRGSIGSPTSTTRACMHSGLGRHP